MQNTSWSVYTNINIFYSLIFPRYYLLRNLYYNISWNPQKFAKLNILQKQWRWISWPPESTVSIFPAEDSNNNKLSKIYKISDIKKRPVVSFRGCPQVTLRPAGSTPQSPEKMNIQRSPGSPQRYIHRERTVLSSVGQRKSQVALLTKPSRQQKFSNNILSIKFLLIFLHPNQLVYNI
jgi:hypothetical protein